MTKPGDVWGVFGGGFGLYGYLPALVQAGALEVVILDRHKPFFSSREELREYASAVTWARTAQELLATVNCLVIAVPPIEQERIVRVLPSEQKLNNLVLEKPLARTPAGADEVLKVAVERAENVRVGFSFLYSDWGRPIESAVKTGCRDHFSIQWWFTAHHYRTGEITWKAQHKNGGGALRFYGIHLLALLESIDAWCVDFSRVVQDQHGDARRWEARFRSTGGGTISVDLDCCRPDNNFAIFRSSSRGESLVQKQTPFTGASRPGVADGRTEILLRLLHTFKQPNAPYIGFYSRVNALWQRVEDETEYTHLT